MGKNGRAEPRSGWTAAKLYRNTLHAILETMEKILSRTPSNGRLVVMTPRYDILVDVVLVLLAKARRDGYEVTQYDLVKSVFLADKQRLNDADRPITYDLYEAKAHGPVPMTVFKLLKENPDVIAKTGPVAWKRRQASEGSKRYIYHSPVREPDLDSIAPNDVDALEEALSFVKTAGVRKVRQLTHEDAAFRDAKRKASGSGRAPIDYALLRPKPDRALIERLGAKSAEADWHLAVSSPRPASWSTSIPRRSVATSISSASASMTSSAS